MFSRRNLLLRACAGGGGVLFSAIRAFGASDFWNKKEASQWTSQEIEALKTKSPWAKRVRGEGFGGGGNRGGGGESMDRAGSQGSFGGMSGADSNGLGGGGGGRGGGGRRGGGGDAGSGGPVAAPQGPEVVIRWESAAPVLAATKFQLPEPLADHYAVSITGLPPQMLMMAAMGAGRAGRRGRESGPPETEAPAPADPQAEAKARQERLVHSATLSVKNHDPESADVVMQTADKQTVIFGFAKANLPLAASDKDVEFVMRAGPATFRAKFEPKEMMYKGSLTV